MLKGDRRVAVRGSEVRPGSRVVIATIFLLTWGVGVWCCFRGQARVLKGPDPFASVERAEWREIGLRLEGDRSVIYLNVRTPNKRHAGFWRAQYALAPTVVLERYHWKQALASLEKGESRLLVAEFTRAGRIKNRRRRIQALRKDAAARNLELRVEPMGRNLLLVEVVRGS